MKRFLGLTTLFVLLGAGLAQAQVTYTVTTVPTFVIETGVAEVLGGVRITASSAAATTVASTIDYFFSTPCDNTTADGMTLGVDGVVFTAANVAIQTAAITNTTTGGCVVPVVVNPGIVIPTPAAGYIELDGVRGRVILTSSVAGSIITATLTATPSNSSFFTVPNVGTVAVSEPGYTQAVTPGVVLQCVGTAVPEPVLTITEGFNAAFVDYGLATEDGDVTPLNERPLFGATNNTHIHISLSSAPAGMTFTWPSAVTSQLNGGVFTPGVAGSALLLDVDITTATDIYYDYACGNQAVCDLTTEVFNISPALTDNTTNYGTAYEQTQLWPQYPVDVTLLSTPPNAAGLVYKPRFHDSLIPVPPAVFGINEPCHTVLLYPWVAFVPALGYDTGIAIANTSTDPFGLLGAGGVQQGTCTLNGYSTATPSAPTPPTITTPYTTPNIPSGATWANAVSAIPALNTGPFEGYIIAVCNFQYGHGSAQISDYLTTSTGVVYGYTALVIPDPYIVGARFPWFFGQKVANSGEDLLE